MGDKSEMRKAGAALQDIKIHVRFKLAALWVSVMFFYVYGDYFNLYVPGKMHAMLAGRMGPLGTVTQGVLVGTALSLAIPAVMIFLSVALSARVNRWLNIVLGLAYTVIALLTIPGSWAFFITYALIEALLTLLIAWYAWSWPKTSAPEMQPID